MAYAIADIMSQSAYVLASGIVEEGSGSGAVHAFVALSPSGLGAGSHSRLFQVTGSITAPRVEELPPATTVDLGRFRREIEIALRPTLDAIAEQGGVAAIAEPRANWICRLVIDYAAGS
jgi:hypothetical protein